MANLDWLLVRDLVMIESATWWKDGPEIQTGEMRTEDIGTEVYFLPVAAHTEKSGSFTNTQRMLQWHHQAVEPAGDARSDLQFTYDLGCRIRAKLAASASEMDRPILDLTWDYPTSGEHGDPDAEAVLAEINGYGPDGDPLSAYTQLKADGSTSCGCWIYCGVRAEGVNQAARRKPVGEQTWVTPDWGWAWPANRRVLYNRASADPDGKPWSDRKALVWWDEDEGKWTGQDVPDFVADRPPSYRPPPDATGVAAISGADPFIMQADGKAWLFAPAGLVDGPLPAHYEPQVSPFRNLVYGQQHNPVRQIIRHPEDRFQPSGDEPGAAVFPYVTTTYRLTEHHTAGGMSRFLPYLSELQPAFFCEVSPELAAERCLEHLGWATVITARTAIEARVLVTERIRPLQVHGRTLHQVGLPGTGDRTGTRPGMPRTSWRTCHWIRTCISRRSRPWPATSGPAVGPAVPRCGTSSVPTSSEPASQPRQGHRCDRDRCDRNRCDMDTATAQDVTKTFDLGTGPADAGLDPAARAGYPDHPPRMGFFTDTSVCIGCKACEVACKEWNAVPEDGLLLTGMSYDNTADLSASTWRHVAFIEQTVQSAVDGGDEVRWLMASNVCKHCTEAACLDVCPTGALMRTEFGTVVVQDDICNGCGYCVSACPFGVIGRSETDGGAHKCTLCYDRLGDGLTPACAKACPTESIQFGPLDELRERAHQRVADLHDAGLPEARLYGADPADGIGGAGAMFLLLDQPEVYGLPPDPVVTTRDLPSMWRHAAAAACTLVAAVVAASVAGRR